MIVVSPYSRGGHISHTYTDHVSTMKFIERNWGLRPVTQRSRDNLPNPITHDNPYVPVNSPAIGDLFATQNQKAIQRTELIIFIRPQIIRDSVDAAVVAEELRAKLRGSKIGSTNPPGAVSPKAPQVVR